MALLMSMGLVTTGTVSVLGYHRYFYPKEYAKFVLANRESFGVGSIDTTTDDDDTGNEISKWSWNGTGIADTIPESVVRFFTLEKVGERMEQKRAQRQAEIQQFINDNKKL